MKIIKWIAEVTGVADKIREENTKLIGQQMYEYSYWFTVGLSNGKYDVCNAYAKYAEYLIKGNTHLYGGQSGLLRDELFKLSQKNERVHK
jgi:hypothetical protein